MSPAATPPATASGTLSAPGARSITVVVPEGVALTLELGSLGERAYAFAVDFLLLLGVLLGGLALVLLALGGDVTVGMLEAMPGWVLALGWLTVFLLRTGWFLLLELAGRGRSVGKRLAGLRVVDARGEPMGVRALVARNLMREVELWLPLGLLLAPETLMPDAAPWLRVLSSVWVLGLLLFPALHPSGARLGDLVAGTRVVRAPRVVLWPDLAEPHASVQRPFLDTHLKVYGEAELAALERLLRMDARLPGHQATLVELSRLVRARTGWSHDERPEDAEPFLRDFYAAQRRHLEDRLRRGDRKRDKHDGS